MTPVTSAPLRPGTAVPLSGTPSVEAMLKIDTSLAVLLAVMGALVGLTGLVFVLVGMTTTGVILVALGAVAGGVGYTGAAT